MPIHSTGLFQVLTVIHEEQPNIKHSLQESSWGTHICLHIVAVKCPS